MSRGYEHLPHTADVKVRAWGETLAVAFSEACRGYTAVLADPNTLGAGHHRTVTLVARTKEALLYDLLAEAIYFHDIDCFLPIDGQFVITHTKQHWTLQGTMTGTVHAGNVLHGDVKAMTYHELKITEEPHKATVEFVLDL